MKKTRQFSKEDIDIQDFRVNLFSEAIKKIEKRVFGINADILQFVRDENGVYSEVRTWEFIEELIKYAYMAFDNIKKNGYESYRISRFSHEEAKRISGVLDEFSEDELKFIRSFLYCVIRISETNAWRNTGGVTQTFEDFINFADKTYDTEGELYGKLMSCELNRHYNLRGGIFTAGAWFLLQFTGKRMLDYYSTEKHDEFYNYIDEKTRNRMYEVGCRNIIDFWKRKEHTYVVDPEFLEQSIEHSLEQEREFGIDIETDMKRQCEEGYSDKIEDDQNKQKENSEAMQAEQERITKQFLEREEFIRQYDIFYKCNYKFDFDADDIMFYYQDEEDIDYLLMKKYFAKIIKDMVRFFTIANELSFIENDDGFFSAMGLIRQAEKRLDKIGRK